MFTSGNGRPLDLKNLANRVIKPELEKAKLEWHGWHAFRRELATNLYRLGVADKSIQAVLRHSNLATTQNSYIKSVPADAVAAMKSLERICTSMHPTTGASHARVV
ncbi:MAG: tyrosine-type recombinase/integrase [Acidobacteriia bacterium]|nr:tyrosine-type recombinase/integrase [Terriglobia bacterium]